MIIHITFGKDSGNPGPKGGKNCYIPRVLL